MHGGGTDGLVERRFRSPGSRGERGEIEERAVEQVLGHGVAERGEDGGDAARILPFPGTQHGFHLLALGVFL